MLFTECAISIFTNFNLLLQREEPTIHLLKSTMEAPAKTIAAQIIKLVQLRNVSSIKEIHLSDDSQFSLAVLQRQNLIDSSTKITLSKISTTDFMKIPNVTSERL